MPHINWFIHLLFCTKLYSFRRAINYFRWKLNFKSSFPKITTPLSSAISAAKQFLPTIPIYVLIVLGGKLFLDDDSLPGLSLNYLLLPILFLLLVITSFGLSLLFATLNVYFRDTTKLLSYIMRIWLYASPVLWQPDMLNSSYRIILYLNPLGPILSANSKNLDRWTATNLAQLIGCISWALIAFLMGSYFFISRERDFAVRI